MRRKGFDLSANFTRRKRHDSSSDEDEDAAAGEEFRRKKRRSEGGHVRDRLQETPSHTGGVSREAKERQVSHQLNQLRKITSGGAFCLNGMINYSAGFSLM